MRFAIVFEIPVEIGNAFEKDPKAGEFFVKFLKQLKPEAGYFSSLRRSGILITKAESEEELVQQLVPIWHIFKTYPQVDLVSSLDEFITTIPKLKELLKDLP